MIKHLKTLKDVKNYCESKIEDMIRDIKLSHNAINSAMATHQNAIYISNEGRILYRLEAQKVIYETILARLDV